MKERFEALDRVRATCAMSLDTDDDVGTYRTDDMELVLTLLEEYRLVIEFLKEDLREVREALVIEDGSATTLAMVESTLTLLTEGDIV